MNGISFVNHSRVKTIQNHSIKNLWKKFIHWIHEFEKKIHSIVEVSVPLRIVAEMSTAPGYISTKLRSSIGLWILSSSNIADLKATKTVQVGWAWFQTQISFGVQSEEIAKTVSSYLFHSTSCSWLLKVILFNQTASPLVCSGFFACFFFLCIVLICFSVRKSHTFSACTSLTIYNRFQFAFRPPRVWSICKFYL